MAIPQGNNPSGKNQLGTPPDAYGEGIRQKTLQREAPMSGAPYSAGAADSPRRAARAAKRGGTPLPAALAPAGSPDQGGGDVAPNPWGVISQLPGISPEVSRLAQRALGVPTV